MLHLNYIFKQKVPKTKSSGKYFDQTVLTNATIKEILYPYFAVEFAVIGRKPILKTVV